MLLGQHTDARVVDAIERLVASAPDRQLCRINPLAFAERYRLDEERRSPLFCMAPRSACSTSPGTCSAPAAAACSTPTPR